MEYCQVCRQGSARQVFPGITRSGRPVVGEPKRDAQAPGLEQRDDGLEVVAVLARDPDLLLIEAWTRIFESLTRRTNPLAFSMGMRSVSAMLWRSVPAACAR